MTNKSNQAIVLSCLVFTLFLCVFPDNLLSMFGDPDTGWHLAAGDLIRQLGSLPVHDPWSFTAGDYRWFNTSWGWDVLISLLYQHFGWHGVIVFGKIAIAVTLAIVFASCFVRSGHGIAAFIVTLLLAVTMLNVNIRPQQVTYLLTAILAFLLSQAARNQCSMRWLLIVPVMMMLWVNVHGGFLAGLSLLGIYGIAALWQKNWRLVYWLLAVGTVSCVACLINPYGMNIFPAVWRILFCVANPFIHEWDGLSFSKSHAWFHIYLLSFLILVMMQPSRALPAEKWAAYAWLAFGVTAIRNLPLFAIVSAPMLAIGLRDIMLRKTQEPPRLLPFIERLCERTNRIVDARWAAYGMLAVSLALSAAVFTPVANAFYQTESIRPITDLSAEIAFLETHYPKARMLNYFDLGGPLIFYARGKIPLFVDGRTEGAYPKEVVHDYMAFQNAETGWEAVLDHYRIDGVIISIVDNKMMDRFISRKGWHRAFVGKIAAIFMRDRI